MIEQATGLAMPSLVLVAALVALASMVRGLTGFGMAIVLVPLLSTVILPDRAVLLAVLVGSLAGFMGLREAWGKVQRQTALTISFAGIAAAPAGLSLLSVTPPDLGRMAIAIMAALSLIVLVLPRRAAMPRTPLAAITTGIVSGLMGSFAAMPGPPVVWFYARKNVRPEAIRDAMIVIFFLGPIAVAAMALAAGMIDLKLVILALTCLPPLLIGNIVGRALFGKFPEIIWRSLMFALVGSSLVGAIFTYWTQMSQ